MDIKSLQHLAVIGGGAWGTALSVALGEKFKHTSLFVREEEVCNSINNNSENKRYLPGIILEPAPHAVIGFDQLKTADVILCVTPAQFLRSTLKAMKPHLRPGTPIILASKGIEIETGALLDNVVSNEAPGHPIAVLSGPTFAKDVARHKPSAITFAMQDTEWGRLLHEKLATPYFRPYLSNDLIGVEVAGAFKNILAIGCGIVAGKNLGENGKAAILTRGINEILQLILALGGKKETLMGLSGIGDIVLTCTSKSSRNFSLGFALGSGQSTEEYAAKRASLSEGYYTSKALHALNKKLKLELPIFELIYQMLYENAPIERVIEQLLSRPIKDEF